MTESLWHKHDLSRKSPDVPVKRYYYYYYYYYLEIIQT